jgi:hypothetical protein
MSALKNNATVSSTVRNITLEEVMGWNCDEPIYPDLNTKSASSDTLFLKAKIDALAEAQNHLAEALKIITRHDGDGLLRETARIELEPRGYMRPTLGYELSWRIKELQAMHQLVLSGATLCPICKDAVLIDERCPFCDETF